MRVPRRTALGVAVLAALSVALPALVLSATVKDLADLATVTYKMSCVPSTTDVTCKSRLGNLNEVIKPASGQETSLLTRVTTTVTIPATGLDDVSRNWLKNTQILACGDSKGVAGYVDLVGAMTKTGVAPTEIHGTCRFDGQMTAHKLAPGGDWIVQSVYLPPPPPTPNPTSRPKPTLKPTTTPAAPSIAPSTAASIAPSESPSAVPTVAATPAATLLVDPAATSSPKATEPAGGGGGGATPAPSAPTFSQSVLGITDVNPGTAELGGSLLLALLMLLIIGFAGELFNDTVENNYDEISGWFKKGALGWLRRFGGKLGDARVGLLFFLLLTALVSSFVDPHFGFDLRSLGEFLGFLVGLVVVLASFKLPPMLTHRRKTGDLGRLRPLPWALVIAALFVLVSRLGNLEPGYLYGIVLGAIFVQDVSDKEEGRETFYGSFWTLSAAVIAWIGLTWLRGLGYDPAGFGMTLLSTAFAAILVSGLEATAFGLMPMRFMPGFAVYKWNRLGWGLLFGLSVFGFLHILIGPTSGYVSSLTPKAFVAALGVFAGYGALSIGTWAYFRFRTASAVEVLEERLER
jgi:hypothetical protein